MFSSHRWVIAVTTALGLVFLLTPPTAAQQRPWVQYLDTVTQIPCGLIHGANAEFVALQGSGALMKVSGPDVILTDLVVDGSGNIFFGNDQRGFIGFDVDGDGDRALFWTTLTGRLVEIDAFDATPAESNLTPRDIRNTACDACSQWDNPATCEDADDGGGANGNGEPSGEDGEASPLAGICGAGSGSAAALSMALLFAGKGRRVLRRRG